MISAGKAPPKPYGRLRVWRRAAVTWGRRCRGVVEEDEEALFMPAASAWARARQFVAAGPVHLFVVGPANNPASRKLLAAGLSAYLPNRGGPAIGPGDGPGPASGLRDFPWTKSRCCIPV